jgi:hypothetical protein
LEKQISKIINGMDDTLWQFIKVVMIILVVSAIFTFGIMRLEETVNKWEYENVCKHDKPYKHVCLW